MQSLYFWYISLLRPIFNFLRPAGALFSDRCNRACNQQNCLGKKLCKHCKNTIKYKLHVLHSFYSLSNTTAHCTKQRFLGRCSDYILNAFLSNERKVCHQRELSNTKSNVRIEYIEILVSKYEQVPKNFLLWIRVGFISKVLEFPSLRKTLVVEAEISRPKFRWPLDRAFLTTATSNLVCNLLRYPYN